VRCFYCAEEIQDEALVCRYCGRDLNFMRPFIVRIAAVESRISELERCVDAIRASPETVHAMSSAASSRTSSRVRIVVPTVVAVIIGVASYAFFKISDGGPWSLIVSIVAPLPCGLWSGLWWRGKHVRAYAIAGATAGILQYVGSLLAYYLTPPRGFHLSMTEVALFGTLYAVGGLLLFVTGALLGDLLERRFTAEEGPSSGAQSIAKSILRRIDRRPASETAVKRVAEFVTAVAPILTFIGSLVAAYLTYQAAIMKK